MDLNSMLFPAPKSSYGIDTIYGELIWIPKNTCEVNDEAQRQHTAPELRADSPQTLKYDTKLFVIKKKAAIPDSVFKIECKEPDLDEISIITTASSKKTPLEERNIQNEANDFLLLGPRDSLLEQELNSTDRVIIPVKPIQKNPLIGYYEKDDNSSSDTDTISVIEEPLLKLIPDHYTRTPKTSHIETADLKYGINLNSGLNRKKTAGISIASKKILFSDQLKQPLCELQQSNETNAHNEKKPPKPLSSLKNINVIENNLLIKIDEKAGVNPTKMKPKPNPSKPLKMLREPSKTSFDPVRMNEHNHQKKSANTPTSVINYSTKNFSKPVNKKPIQKQEKIEEDEHDREDDEEDCKRIEIDTCFDAIGEFTNPVTTRRCFDDCYKLNPKPCIPKSSSLVRSLVSPPPLKRFELRMKTKNDNTEFSTKAKVEFTAIKPPVSGIISPLRSVRIPLSSKTVREHVPCMLLRSDVRSSKMMIYFHGNAEDINLATGLLVHVRDNLKVHVVAVEYPGYGLYKGTPNESKILEDAECVYDYFVTKLRVDPRDLIIFGRSIGSGPASYLASKRNVGALVLMSPFTSIRSVVKDLAGSWARYLIKERFDNLQAMSKVTCPTFLVHGQSDNLIPFSHSKQLHGKILFEKSCSQVIFCLDACRAPSELFLPKKMDHIEFDFFEDFSAPLTKFLMKCDLKLENAMSGRIHFPKSLFETPNYLKT